jgi:hypothetical protein
MSNLKTGRPSRKDKAIASMQDLKIETVRMNINMPKDLYKQVKLKALEEDSNITDLVKRLLEDHISK